MQEQVIEGYRLSPQQKILFDSKQCRGAVAQGSLWFQGILDRDHLSQSLRAIIEEHEILRTRFHGLGEVVAPIQVVAEVPSFPLTYQEFAQEDTGLVADCIRAEAELPFDLKNDPPIRFLLARFGERRHLLVFTLAAFCADAQTLDNLIKEIMNRFGGEQDTLAYADDEDGPIQYVQFSEWQNSLDEEEDADRGKAFWQRFLEHKQEAPRLPWQASETLNHGFRPEEVCFTTPLKANPLFETRDQAFVLSCWLQYLARLTPGEDLPMRVCFDGRSLEELQPAMGLFITPAPLRFRPNNHRTVIELVTQVERQLTEIGSFAEFYPHEETPLHEEPWTLAFEYRELGGHEDRWGPAIQVHHRQWITEPFKLKLIVEVKGQTRFCRLCYDANLFDREGVKRWATDMANLCEQAANQPQARLARLPHTAPANKRLLLDLWGRGQATQPLGPKSFNLVTAFQAAVNQFGQRTAVIDDGRHLTFSELDQLTTQLANTLQNKGAKLGEPIPLVTHRGVQALVGVWGILKAGGAYLPIDPNQPTQRLQTILASTQSQLIVTESTLADLFFNEVSLVCLDQMQATQQPGCELAIDPKSPAYVMFTSGSTGTPKGVVVPHHSVIHLAQALQTDIYNQVSEPQRVSLNANLYFDSSIKQLTRTLFGHTLVIPAEEIRSDGLLFSQWLADHNTQVLDCTPSQFRYLLDAGLPPCLKLVLLGGEAIDQPLWDLLLAERAARDLSFFNVYGPTECTVNAVWGMVSDDKPNLGRPIPGVHVSLLDEAGYLQPTGAIGELCISGPGVSTGYRGDPVRTAEKFIPNPASELAGDRIYRSGDLAMFTQTGELVFLGRRDHQVKLRGFRIELGEIEAAIRQCEGVREAAVGLTDEGEKRLIGYVVPHSDSAFEPVIPLPEMATGSQLQLPNGLSVFQQNKNETEYLYDEIFNKLTYALYGITLPERAVVFDIGANIGMFSLFVLQHCKQPQIYAFEPLPPIYETLAHNLRGHGSRIQLFNVGCSFEEQQVDFNYYPHYSMMSSASEYAKPEEEVGVVKRFLEREAEGGKQDAQQLLDHADDLLGFRFEGETHRCHLRRLADLIEEEAVTHIDLLKVDVQRAELDVLRGLSDKNWDIIDQVVMEVHQDPTGDTANRVQEIQSLLEGYGFEVVAEQDELLEGTDRYNFYARKAGLTAREDQLDGYRQQLEWPANEPTSLNEEALLASLRDRLPGPMLPSAILFLNALPLNRNGKVDRKALPQPSSRKVAFRGSSNHLEAQLVDLWADLFGLPDIGVDDNFFQLGGHSLLATQLMSRIRRECDVDLPLRMLFEAPTIAQLAHEMEVAGGLSATVEPAIVPVPRQPDGLPLSFAQQRLWFIDQLEPGGTMYLNPFALACRGPLDLSSLDQAMVALVERHEILRTRYISDETNAGEARQIVEPAAGSYIEFVDLSEESQPTRERAAQDLVVQEAQTPFDLSLAPLFRFKVVRLAEEHHLLLFTTHHIACDEWSLQLMVREINALYGAFSVNKPHGLPAPDLQYADFATWQRAWLSGEVLEQQLDFWRKTLAGIPPVLNLPVDSPRSAMRSYRGRYQSIKLDSGFYQRLNPLIRKHDATAFMTYLAAFSILLSRYSGQNDICIGTPIAGRGRMETENLLGCFINMLVIRAQLENEPSFDQLIQRIKDQALVAFSHQDLPFEKLVESLEVGHDMNHSPIFQVALHVEDDQHRDTVPEAQYLELAGTESTALAKPDQDTVALYDLVVTIAHRRDQVTVLFNYSRDLFQDSTITAMMAHFRDLLEQLAARPEEAIGTVAFEAADERRIALNQWQDHRETLASPSPMVEFARAVQRTPTAPALTAAGETLTFENLAKLANQIAQALTQKGVGPDQVVGIYAERNASLIAAMLGVLAAGGAYLPLDPRYPPNRIKHLIQAAKPTVILTQVDFQELLPDSAEETLLLDGPHACHLGQPTSAPTSKASNENLAYVLFTSGSSGTPKGVMVTHASLANLWSALKTKITSYDGGRGLHVGLNAPLAFDSSVKQWLSLCGGHHLHLVPEDTRTDADAFVQFTSHHRLDVIDVTPSILDLLLDAGFTDGDHVPSDVLIGGEPISAALWKRIQAISGPRFHNLYGPTECTVDTTCHSLDQSMTIPVIGSPLTNVSVHVLDNRLRPVPVGLTGELYIGGKGLSRGYLSRPRITATQFLPNPFTDGAETNAHYDFVGDRLYRTGDLVRRHSNGSLEFLGRRDHQVKIRGHRVELHEIECHLDQHPAIRSAVTLLDGEHLVAFVVPRDGGQGSPSALREWLAERLPAYMVPTKIIAVSQIPRTHNQKIDRAALLKLGREEPRQNRVKAHDMIEEILIQILSELLGVTDINPHQGFFELGGHSLVAIQLVARLRQVFSLSFKLRDVFDHPQIADLATVIQSRLRNHAGLKVAAITPVARDTDLPLSFSQQRLWFLDQLDPGHPAYNSPKVELLDLVDGSALGTALDGLTKRHEILRTRFPTRANQPRQVIEHYHPKPLPMIDLSGLSDPERSNLTKHLMRAEANHRFDLSQRPPVRFRLLRLKENEHLLLFNMHHIITDARSLQILWQEAQSLYDAELRSEAAPLSQPQLQYGDYAVHQQRWFHEHRFDDQITWWKTRLQGIPLLDLPLDLPRPPIQTMAGAKYAFTIDARTSDRLRQLAKHCGATPFMVLLAGFKAFLSRICHQQDIAIGVPASGRTLLTSEQIVGCFINTLVLRSQITESSSFSTLLEQVRETAIGAFTHQELPFEKLVEELSPQRDTSHSPLFQAFYNHQEVNNPSAQTQPRFKLETAIAKFDLTLHVSHHPDSPIAMLFEYKTALFHEASIANLARCFSRLLAALTEAPDQPIATIGMLTARQAKTAIMTHDGRGETLSKQMVCRQFEQLAQKTPEATGLLFEDRGWTYRELNEAVNRLAHYLSSLTDSPEFLVGVFLERGYELVSALLAIQKAGGAYVPIDPSYPSERIGYMLDDAATPIILTHSQLLDKLPRSDAQVICLDQIGDQLASMSTENPGWTIHPDQLAYVIYTSGSTGRPKGVQISHGALANFIGTMAIKPGIQSKDRLLAVTTISFDIAGLELYLPLTHGATLVMANVKTSANATALSNLLEARDITVMQATPVTWMMLRNNGWSGKANLRVLCGGETLTADLASYLTRVGGQAWNLYGPTETTIWSGRHQIGQDDRSIGDQRAVQLGHPIANTSFQVLDSCLNPVPAGINGQLYIGGQGLARGYRNRAALTATRFIPDAYSELPGGRLYASGDLVRNQRAGLQFQGRNDFQVKIRGFRIELGEIRALLDRHEDVAESVISVHRPRPDEARLIAFIIAGERKPAAADLRSFLRQFLPDYMIPSVYHFLEQWPQTLNGKIDQRALMDRAANGQQADEVIIHPRTDSEWLVWRIFADLLGTHAFGVKESFFLLGGHSLLAISLVTRIAQATGKELPLTSIFSLSNVEALADAISGHYRPKERTQVRLWSGPKDRAPLFWVHPQGGTAFCYADLASRLTPSRTSYGFNAPGLLPETQPLTSIRQLAEHYLQELERIQPEGPLYLGGWSFGGLVAFELARLLEIRGRQVTRLFIVDTFLPLEPYDQHLDEREQLLSFITSLDTTLDELGLELSGDWQPNDAFERLLGHAKDAGILPAGAERESVARHFRVFSAHSRAARSYRPGTFDGEVILMHTAEPRPGKLANWRTVAAKLQTLQVDGKHDQLLSPPQVEELANHLAPFLS